MTFCKHRVMDKCKKDGRPCFFSDDCFEQEEKVQTNADCIRAMSDKELAAMLNRACPPFKKDKRCNMVQCRECWLEWLRQPAE